MVKLKIHKPIPTQSTYFMNNTFSSLNWGKFIKHNVYYVLSKTWNANPICIIAVGTSFSAKSTLKYLTAAVFAEYDPTRRPYCPGKTPVNITMDLAIRQLIDMVRTVYIYIRHIIFRSGENSFQN